MGLRKFKPVTPGTRFRVGNDFSEITTNVPEKSLVVKQGKSGGRNNTGKMTMRYVGGGHKQLYRLIDFKRDNTIQIVLPVLRCYIMQMVRKDTSSLQKESKLALKLSPVIQLHQKWVTISLWQIFL